MDIVKHKLYDALIGDFSISQTLNVFPINRRTPVLGLGFYQNVFYINSMNFKFQAGLLFNIGFKL